MKKILDSILSFTLTVAIILPGIPVQAAVPQIINFQGRLTNSSGVPITNASPGVNIVFKLYDQSNAGGNQLGSGWSETQTGVPVSNGIFSVQIGSNTALPLSVFGNTAVYVDISVGGETLYPRPRLLASPYALNSAAAEKLLTARNINGVAFDGTADITITGYTHPNHSGDVTSVGDGATTIAANAVTLAKFQQIATQSILGRTTAGTGNAEVLTAAQTKTILSLGNVENTALSSWAGSANITTIGTLSSGAVPWANVTGAPSYIIASNTLTGLVQSVSDGNSYFTGGNVGIGTADPGTARLNVQKSGDGEWAGIIANTLGSGSPKGLLVLTGQNSSNVGLQVANGSLAAPTVVFTVTGAGNVGIGTTSPGAYRLSVVGGDANFSLDTYARAYYYTSDARLKTNLRPIRGLDIIMKMNGTYFDWIKDGSHSAGLIAQEVEKVIPEAVSINKETGMRNLNYSVLTAPMIESIKELKNEVDALKKEVRDLKSELNSQKGK